MKKLGQKKIKMFAVILAAVLGCIAIGLIVAVFIDKRDNPHIIFHGDSGKVNLKEERESTFCVGVSTSIVDTYPYVHGDETAAVLKKLVYEPLININNDCEISYCNAKSITFQKEGREATVKLNREKAFSNKEKVKADVVAKSYKWFMENDSAYRTLLSRINDIRVADDETLVFTFTVADCDNINIFNIPLIYQAEKNGNPAIGTGPYCIDSLKPYGEIVLKENSVYGSSPEYDRVLIKTVDYSNMEKLLKSQSFDIFLFNKKEYADVVKADKAYDIYEFGKDTGWFLKQNPDNEELGNAIAKITKDWELFQENSYEGIQSSGVVSAYIKPGYYSMLKEGSLDGTKNLSVMHDYTTVATNVYQLLEKRLGDKKIKCDERISEFEDIPKEFAEDLLIFYGSFKDGMTRADHQMFFKEYKTIDAKEFYNLLEEYFVSKNSMIPLSKDTIWVASLATRDTMGLTE